MTHVLRLLEIIFPILAIAAAGWAYGRWRRPDMRFANQLNMEVFVPALIFHVLAGKAFEVGAYGMLALATVVVVVVTGLLAMPAAWLLRVAPRTLVPSMMFKNTGNMGLPMAVLAFGEEALPAAVVIFLTSNVLHFTLGAWIMDHRAGFAVVLRIPMIQATVAGLVFSVAGWHLPGPIAVPIEMLGQISIPLMLFALGVRLIDIDFADWHVGSLGAVLCPLLSLPIALILVGLLSLPAVQAAQLLILGVLPPAVLNYMVAENYRQEPSKVASIVMMGNLFAVVTLPLILALTLPA